MQNQNFVSLPPQQSNQPASIIPQDSQQGQIFIQTKVKKICLNQNDQNDSQWSLDSIDQIKGVDLKKLQAQEEGEMEQRPPQKQKIKVTYPQKPQLKQNNPIHLVGSVIQIVGDLLIVQSCNSEVLNVVDLDGWVCNQKRDYIGFVIDVLGRIQHPFYAIKPQQNLQLSDMIRKQIYYIQGTKVLNQQTIKSIKSKHKLDEQLEVESSSSQQLNQKDFSQQKPQIYKQHRNNFVRNKNARKGSFDNHRVQQRSRTRDNYKGKNSNHNDKYLESMYAMHYAQMMQFYSPTYQTPPPPFNGFSNQHNPNMQQQFPPNFGNQIPNFPPGNNYQGNQNNWQYKK